jgi:hypothetical protein
LGRARPDNSAILIFAAAFGLALGAASPAQIAANIALLATQAIALLHSKAMARIRCAPPAGGLSSFRASLWLELRL